MVYGRRWLRPLKILESYVMGAPGVLDTQDAERQLYWAVMDGAVRVRYQGVLLQGEELWRLRERVQSLNKPLWYFPPDLEISIDGAREI